MKKATILLVLIFLCIPSFAQRNTIELFRVYEGGRMGYIDSTGAIRIPLKFIYCSYFTEGLAAARTGGKYGYIDTLGNFAIEPRFDHAQPFNEGVALVYLDGKPIFIDRTGVKTFARSSATAAMGRFRNGQTTLRTTTGKCGIINKKGTLVVDTIFSDIGSFIKGFARVDGPHHDSYRLSEKTKSEVGIIDSTGKFTIPYGKYREIIEVGNGTYICKVSPNESRMIDAHDKVLFKLSMKNDFVMNRGFDCGLSMIHVYRHGYSSEKNEHNRDAHYPAFVDITGKLIINDTNIRRAIPFNNNRTFVENKRTGMFSLLNTKGKVLAQDSFNYILDDGFFDGFAFVRSDDLLWGMIDTNGRYVIQPQFDGIMEPGLMDNEYFFFSKDSNDISQTGIARKDGTIVLDAVMQRYDKNGFYKGLLECIIDGKPSYLNKKGKIVWQADNMGKGKTNMNLDHMSRGYFYVLSTPSSPGYVDTPELEKYPKTILAAQKIPSDSICVIVKTDMISTINDVYNGFTVWIANTKNEDVKFAGQDGRLNMKVQALTSTGWQDIEYLPNSWCGNSYHTITLGSNEYWTLTTPVYEGDIKTKLRIELQYIDPFYKGTEMYDAPQLTIYSNEYEGSINPAQLWRKESYTPSGIMDPYLE